MDSCIQEESRYAFADVRKKDLIDQKFMDQSGGAAKTSRLPRPSRLPVPQTASSSGHQPRLGRGAPSGISRPAASSNGGVSGASGIHNGPAATYSATRRVSGNTFVGSNRGNGVTKRQESTENDDGVFKRPLGRPPSRQMRSGPDAQSHHHPSALQEIADLNEESAPGTDPPSNMMSLDTDEPTTIKPRKARPSLSERTMETLSHVPPSPSPRRRRSSVYGMASPMRPTSAMGDRSRPGSSLDQYIKSPGPSLRQPSFSSNCQVRPMPSLQGLPSDSTAGRRRLSSSVTQAPGTPVNRSMTGSKGLTGAQIRSGQQSKGALRSLAPSDPPGSAKRLVGESKTLPSRPARARPSLGSFLEDTHAQTGKEQRRAPTPTRQIPKKTVSRTTPVKDPQKRRVAGVPTRADGNAEPAKTASSPSSKSSTALRETIAKAKAARRAPANNTLDELMRSNPVLADIGDEDGDDPFNQNRGLDGNKGLLKTRIETARTTGRLDVSALDLSDIPQDVLHMFDPEALESSKVSWYEAVDLVRLVAADNQIKTLSPDVFPDVDPQEAIDDEGFRGNPFGGIQSLDIHGNLLSSLPIGLRRLERLSKLNLTGNHLGNACFEVLIQCQALQELRLCSNQLTGQLPEEILCLQHLEILDLHDNKLTSLPGTTWDLKSLRVLNVTRNQLTFLHLEDFRSTGLTELYASHNKTGGAFMSSSVDQLANLKILEIAHNGLQSFWEGSSVDLPQLQQLDVSGNVMTSMGDFSSLKQLLTVKAENNRLTSLPEGFTELTKLRQANFAGNDIKAISEQIGSMEHLTALEISRNPLRERRFLNMTTTDLKRLLRGRLEADETIQEEGPSTSHGVGSTRDAAADRTAWALGPGGCLDRANTGLHELTLSDVDAVMNTDEVRSVALHHNSLRTIPTSLQSFGSTLRLLNLEKNQISGNDYLSSPLSLPNLQILNLSQNSMTSLSALITHLSAPSLRDLDVRVNRLASIPTLRNQFPELRKLSASNNEVRELFVPAFEGLEEVDLRDNHINGLPAELGLLGSIKLLEVRGNAFRVPRHNVLDKGTEALKAWLRDKIPESQRVLKMEDEGAFF